LGLLQLIASGKLLKVLIAQDCPGLQPRPIYHAKLSPIPLSINAECGNERKY